MGTQHASSTIKERTRAHGDRERKEAAQDAFQDARPGNLGELDQGGITQALPYRMLTTRYLVSLTDAISGKKI